MSDCKRGSRTITRCLLVATPLVMAIGACAPEAEVVGPVPTGPEVASFRVGVGTDIPNLLDRVSQEGAGISAVETVYSAGGQTWFDSVYSPPQEDLDSFARALSDERRAIWRAFEASLQDSDPDDLREAVDTVLSQTDDELAAGLRVFSLAVAGEAEGVVAIAEEFADQDGFSLLSDAKSASAPIDDASEERNHGSGIPANSTWMPSSGSVVTGPQPGYSTRRFVRQNLQWSNHSGFHASGSYSVYEHEFYFYNYNPPASPYSAGTYLNAASTAVNCYPTLVSNTHNFPASAYAYLDTRYNVVNNLPTCPSSFSEVEFSFGLVNAVNVVNGTTYYVLMVATNGTTTTDEFKLQGDIGRCAGTQSWCRSNLTWSTYSHDVHERIQPDTSGTWQTGGVPGTVSWLE